MKLTKNEPRTFTFDREPTYAERWDITVQEFYPHRAQYVREFEEMLASYGIGREARILDTCAGAGNPALDLIRDGYRVDALDASADMVELYREKAVSLGLDAHCVLGTWADLPQMFRPNSYDLLICHGNSFAHAPGGWNQEIASFAHADKAYRDTLDVFRAMLAPGGWLYLDKSRDHDDPQDIRELICRFDIGGQIEECWFVVEHRDGIRRASFLRVLADGSEIWLPNTAPLLPTAKLEALLGDAGFTTIQPITLPSEGALFQGWMVR